MLLKRNFISIFIIAILALVLVGCGGDDTTTETPTTAATTEEITTQEATTTEEPTTVTTEEPVDLAALIAELRTQYADTLDSETFVATENLTLVATIGGVDITWSSNNTAILENNGTIHRPAYTEGDQTVILTATLTYGEDSENYMFFVTVQALDKTDEERANEVFDVICTFPTKESWSSADVLEFLTTGQDLDGTVYTVVWTSSASEYINPDGTITQPVEENVEVTMTATITINTVDYTRDVVFTVAKLASGTPVSTIAEGIALGVDTYIEFQGVTVIAKFAEGQFFFTDGVDIMYVYTTLLSVEVGQVYDISGVFVWYYSAPELTGSATQPLKAVASDAAVSELTPEAVTVTEAIQDLVVPSAANPFYYHMVSVTGTIYYDSTLGTYGTFLVPTGYDVNTTLDTTVTDAIMIYYKSDITVLQALAGQTVTVDLMMYGWRTDKLVWYANFWGTAADVEVVIVDDAEAVQTALDAIVLPATITENTTLDFPAELYGVTLTYASDNETVITTAGVVDVSTLTNQETVTITVTATRGTVTDTKVITVKVGEVPLTTILEIYDDVTIPDGSQIKIQGIVTAQTKNSGFWIQDTTAGLNIYIYDSTQQAELAALVGQEVILVGEKDIYNGLYEIKNVTEITVVNATPTPITPADLTGVVLDATNLAAYKGQLISFDGYVLKATITASSGTSFNFTLINLTTGNEISIRVESTLPDYAAVYAELTSYVTGSAIDVSGIIVSWYNTPQLAVVNADNFAAGAADATDADLVAFDAAKFPTTDVTWTDDYTLPTRTFSTATVVISTELQAYITDDIAGSGKLLVVQPVGTDVTGTVTFTLTRGTETTDVVLNVTLTAIAEQAALDADAALLPATLDLDANYDIPDAVYGSTFTVTGITGDAATYLNYTMMPGTIVVVSRPAGADATGVISIEVTLGTATPATIDIDVTVLQSVAQVLDLFFSEYGEGSSNNKWLEIYNPTGADVDLSAYSISEFANGSLTPFYTLTLSGTLAAGEVYVIRNVSAVLANVVAEADLIEAAYPNGVCFFNGNDAVVLYHGTSVIDSIGQFGVSTDYAKDVTLVRNETVNFGDNNPYDEWVVGDEWTTYAIDTQDYVGSHTMVIQVTELFFSEYGEGSSNNKWLEIYNGTGADVDLSTYSISEYANGSLTPFYTLTLSGTLAAGDVYVIRNVSAVLANVVAEADLIEAAYPNGVCFFNGNDAVVLYNGTEVVDRIGQFGVSTDYAKDVTIVRNANIFKGDTNPYAEWIVGNEWTSYAIDTQDYVGSHTTDYSAY